MCSPGRDLFLDHHPSNHPPRQLRQRHGTHRGDQAVHRRLERALPPVRLDQDRRRATRPLPARSKNTVYATLGSLLTATTVRTRSLVRAWNTNELIRFVTLPPTDVAFVDPVRGRGPADRLGLAGQLATSPWLGFVPDDVAAAPPVAVARIAERLAIDPNELAGYGHHDQTRSDHLRLVAEYLRWKPAPAGSEAMKELEQFLTDRATEHDSPAAVHHGPGTSDLGQHDPAGRDDAGRDGRHGAEYGRRAHVRRRLHRRPRMVTVWHRANTVFDIDAQVAPGAAGISRDQVDRLRSIVGELDAALSQLGTGEG